MVWRKGPRVRLGVGGGNYRGRRAGSLARCDRRGSAADFLPNFRLNLRLGLGTVAGVKGCLNGGRSFSEWVAVLSVLSAPLAHSLYAEKTPSQSALAVDAQGWLDLMPLPNLQGWTRIAISPANALSHAQWQWDSARNFLVCDGDGGHDQLRRDTERVNRIFHVECCFPPGADTTRNYDNDNNGIQFGISRTVRSGISGRSPRPAASCLASRLWLASANGSFPPANSAAVKCPKAMSLLNRRAARLSSAT